MGNQRQVRPAAMMTSTWDIDHWRALAKELNITFDIRMDSEAVRIMVEDKLASILQAGVVPRQTFLFYIMTEQSPSWGDYSLGGNSIASPIASDASVVSGAGVSFGCLCGHGWMSPLPMHRQHHAVANAARVG